MKNSAVKNPCESWRQNGNSDCENSRVKKKKNLFYICLSAFLVGEIYAIGLAKTFWPQNFKLY